MKIGELARLAQCTVETIRYYEKASLLPVPPRTEGNYRNYEQIHVDRLRFIRNCRALDMSHEEIHVLLDAAEANGDDCAAINHLLDAHIGHVSARIAELHYLETQLKTLRQSCQGVRSTRGCNIVQRLASLDISLKKPGKRTHI